MNPRTDILYISTLHIFTDYTFHILHIHMLISYTFAYRIAHLHNARQCIDVQCAIYIVQCANEYGNGEFF